MRDFAQVRADGVINADVARRTLLLERVDDFGLGDMDGLLLRTIIEKFDGGPVGLQSIAVAVGEDPGTIEEVYEPYLVQIGFLERTSRGRMATPHAFRHLGYVQRTRGGGEQQVLL
jgi:Holliday junction DNA helicase RuvB